MKTTSSGTIRRKGEMTSGDWFLVFIVVWIIILLIPEDKWP